MCSESTEAARVTLAARAALALVPRELRPERVVVHLDPALPRGAPALGALETHVESASLFARSSSTSELEPSILLHEFAHLRARGARPQDRAGRRIFAAIEEGVADYYAAVITGSARLSVVGRGSRFSSDHPAFHPNTGSRCSGRASIRIPSGGSLQPRCGSSKSSLVRCFAT